MRDNKIKNKRAINKKGKNIRTNRRKVGRLHLTRTTYSLNQRREKTNNTVMTDPTKVLQTLTRQEMSGIRERRRTKTMERKSTEERDEDEKQEQTHQRKEKEKETTEDKTTKNPRRAGKH